MSRNGALTYAAVYYYESFASDGLLLGQRMNVHGEPHLGAKVQVNDYVNMNKMRFCSTMLLKNWFTGALLAWLVERSGIAIAGALKTKKRFQMITLSLWWH